MESKKQRKQGNQKESKPCEYGISCKRLVTSGCTEQHHPDDFQAAKQYQDLSGFKEILMCYDQIPVIVGGQLLKVELDSDKGFQVQKGFYYVGKVAGIDKSIVKVKALEELGKFGDFKTEKNQLSFFEKCYYLETKPQNERYVSGRCIVRNGRKSLRSELPRDFFWTDQEGKGKRYPILKDCTVIYAQVNPNNIKIKSIKYPEIFTFGTLEFKKDTGLTFVPYNRDLDQMTVQNINNSFRQHTNMNNYSFLVSYKSQAINEINEKLKKVIVHGKFLDWPLESAKPLITMESQLFQNSLENMKLGILYTNKISPNYKFSERELKESNEIISKAGLMKADKYHKDRTKTHVFTVDSPSTKVFDDAFSIQEADEEYLVGIYMADVCQWVKQSGHLNKAAKQRDSTMYIKNFHFPMLPGQLGRVLSLKAGGQNFACSLLFKIDKEGRIDMSTIRLQQSLIKVEKNYSYKRFDQTISEDESKPESLLEKVVANRSKLGQTKLIDTLSKGQNMVQSLMVCSAQLVNYILDVNLERISTFKKRVQDKLEQIMGEQVKRVTEFQDKKADLLKVRKGVDQLSSEMRSKKRNFEKQLIRKQAEVRKDFRKKLNQALKLLKPQSKVQTEQTGQDQQYGKPRKDKRARRVNQQGESESGSDSDGGQSISSGTSQSDTTVETTRQQQLQVEVSEEKNLKQQAEKQKISDDLIKELLNQDKQPKQQKIKDLEPQQVIPGDKYVNPTTVQGARKYISNIFRHFNIEPNWKTRKTIIESFDELIKQRQPKHLFRQYVQMVKIRNYQYFPLLVTGVKANEMGVQDRDQRSGLEQRREDRPISGAQRNTNVRQFKEKKSKGPQKPSDDIKLDQQQTREPDTSQNLAGSDSVGQVVSETRNPEGKQTNPAQKQKEFKAQKKHDKRAKKASKVPTLQEGRDGPVQNTEQKGQNATTGNEPVMTQTSLIQPVANDLTVSAAQSTKQLASSQKKQDYQSKGQTNKRKGNQKDKVNKKYNQKNSSKVLQKGIDLKEQDDQTGQQTQVKSKQPVGQLQSKEAHEEQGRKSGSVGLKTRLGPNQQQQPQTSIVAVKQHDQQAEKESIPVLDSKNQQLPKQPLAIDALKIPKTPKVISAYQQLKKDTRKKIISERKLSLQQLDKTELEKFNLASLQLQSQISKLKDDERQKSDNLLELIKEYEPLVELVEWLHKFVFVRNKKLSTLTKYIRQISVLIKHKLTMTKKYPQLVQNVLKVSIDSFGPNRLQNNIDSIQKMNSLQKYQYLSWSNPIREYSCLAAERLLKNFKWIIKGTLDVEDVVELYEEVDQIRSDRKSILNWNKNRVLTAETKKNVKEANLAIEKLQFVNRHKANPHPVNFLIIFERDKHKAFHPILDELELDGPYNGKELYVEKEGRLVIEKEFPLILKVKLS